MLKIGTPKVQLNQFLGSVLFAHWTHEVGQINFVLSQKLPDGKLSNEVN